MGLFDLLPSKDPLFRDPWLMWGQAVVHTQTLEADVETFVAAAHTSPLMTHRTEYIARRHGFAVYVDSILTPIPVRWGLLLGDVANNYRSSLDQLAWALVSRGRTPPYQLTRGQRNRIYFPICDKRTQFNGDLAHKLPGVRRADLAKIRSYQPYHYGSRPYRHHNLLLLSEINNGNKHRTIQPVWDVPEATHLEILSMDDCVLSDVPSIAVRQSLTPGAEIVLIKVRKTGPEPRIEVFPDVIAQPSLEQYVWLKEWLDSIRGNIFLILAEFSSPPEELLEIGIDFSRFSLDPDAV